MTAPDWIDVELAKLPPPRTSARFPLRLPSDLRQQLEQVARADNRTLNNLIMHVLSEWRAGRMYVPARHSGVRN